MTRNQLERRVRYLTMYAGGSTLLFLLLTVAAFSSGRVGAWKEVKADAAKLDTLRAGHIEAERIDVVEPDGKLALAMANTKRIPGAVVEGEELIDHREGEGIAGMIFYNAEETEMGGLIFHSESSPEGYESFGHLSFDQYNQDQAVALNYEGTNSSRAAGLRVWDRPTSVTIEEMVRASQMLRSGSQDSAQVAEAQRVVEKTREETAARVFVGSENQQAGVFLRDTENRQRIRMYVDSLDRPRLVFLDEEGNVVERLSPEE